jgi:hypothetical protein
VGAIIADEDGGFEVKGYTLAGASVALLSGGEIAVADAEGNFSFIGSFTSLTAEDPDDPRARLLTVAVRNSASVETAQTIRILPFGEDPAPADDATLASVSIIGNGVAVSLGPVFDPAVTSYISRVHNDVSSVEVGALTSHPNATVTINGEPVPQSIPLSVGSNTITTVVLAADGKTPLSYTFTIIRDEVVFFFKDGLDSHVLGANTDIVYIIDKDLSLYQDGNIRVNGITLTADQHAVSAGSTRVTLGAKYLDTLPVGYHTLAVAFGDGTVAEDQFQVLAAGGATDADGGDSTPAAGATDADEEDITPATGDTSLSLLALMAILVLTGAALLLFCWRYRRYNLLRVQNRNVHKRE